MSNKVNWDILLSDNEVKIYLNLEDLIQLSLCSRLIRLKLNKNIFKIINLTKFLNNKSFHSMFTNEAYDQDYLELLGYEYLNQAAKQANRQVWELKVFYNPFQKFSWFYEKDIYKFKKSLERYQKFIQGINLRFSSDFYQCLREIPFILPNLTRLALDSSTITLILCQSLFDKLNNLKSISIKECKLIQNRHNAITLKFPDSVVKLSFHSCKLSFIESEVVPVPYFTGEGIQLKYISYSFPTQFLENLLYLNYSDKPGKNYVLAKFIALNPLLKTIKLDSKNIGYKVMLALSQKEVEFELIIHSNEYSVSIDRIYDLPIIPSLKYLELDVPIRAPLYDMLPIIMPNVEELVVNFDNYYKAQTIEFIQKFNATKFLKINLCFNSLDFKDLKLLTQLGQLQEIIIDGFNQRALEDSNLVSFLNLKSIKVMSLETSHIESIVPSNWKIFNYQKSYKVYKIEI